MSKHIALILSCLGILCAVGNLQTAQAATPETAFVSPLARPKANTVSASIEPSRAAVSPSEEFSYEFLHRVTSRVIGEGNFAIPQIACTVRNRWRKSQSAGLDAVLRAYYAPDKRPEQWQIDLVRQVFTGELPCPETWWYALSLQDTSYWTPHDRVATVVRLDAKFQIWIYER